MSYAETLTLDQLRVLLAVLDTGTFSGAALQLGRSQGAISYQVAAIESALDLALFDRSGRRARLTDAGRVIAQEAGPLLARVDHLRGVARSMRDGVEPRLSLAVDALFPTAPLVNALQEFRTRFPETPLELSSGVRSAVSQDVASGASDVGILGRSPISSALVVGASLRVVTLVAVCASDHPLAVFGASPVPAHELAAEVHIVLRERGASPELSIASPASDARTWRVSDEETRLRLVEAGLGWSRIPMHAVASRLESGVLVALNVHPLPSRFEIPMCVVHRRDRPPGPAARWLLDQLAT